jgi:parallel beta-helix repeat protein
VYQAQGRYAEALERFQQSLAIARALGDQDGEGATLNNIGAVYQAQGRYAEALVAYQQAMDTFEVVRTVAGSEAGRASFIAQHASLYVQAAGLFHQQGQDEEAFFTSERGRARAFLDSLATGHVELSDDEAAALLAQEQEAYAGRQAAQDALARARALDPSRGSGQAPPDPTLVADLEAQLAEAEAAYTEALAAIEARGDQLAALVPGRGTVLGLSEVQALLDEETTLLSYFVLDDETLAFLITRSSFEVIPIEVSRQELTDRVIYLRDVIPFRKLEATLPAAAELHQLLIAPLSTSLHTPRLAIVPHGPLHYLPFAALVDPDTDQYLLERYTLLTLPSASALPFMQQNRHPPVDSKRGGGSALILGNPVTGDPNLAPLIFAEREAQAIAEFCSTEPLLGDAATESAVREWASQASILHLAAHGSYNPYTPLYSTIALAPDETNDGRLEVHEVYGLDLTSADLVVLSACQTHLGELSAGDELVGLTRAFFFAGTPTVVASLWSVDDEATGLLMERFYTHLGQGMSKAAALRQAQLEVWETHPDPYYWAGFVLSGDGSPMAAPVRLSSWVWLIVGGGALIVLVLGGVVWRRTARHPEVSEEEIPSWASPQDTGGLLRRVKWATDWRTQIKQLYREDIMNRKGLLALLIGLALVALLLIAYNALQPTLRPRGTPSPTPGPVTVRVAPDGSGDYPSLGAAIEVVSERSTLILDPGAYRLAEPLDIHKSLYLVGAGMDQTEIVSEAEEYVVRFSGDGSFSAEDLTFRHQGEAAADVVIVQGGEATFTRCRFTGAAYVEGERGGSGLQLEGLTTGLVQDCVAEGNGTVGIFIGDQAQATLEANTCSDNGIGIICGNSASGVARRNQCTGNQIGIGIANQAQVTLEENVFSDNGTGIFIMDEAQPTLEENICSDNESAGISYFDNAGGVARQNRTTGNGIFDITVLGQAHPTLERNVCSSGILFAGGIYIEESAAPALINNDCDTK